MTSSEEPSPEGGVDTVTAAAASRALEPSDTYELFVSSATGVDAVVTDLQRHGPVPGIDVVAHGIA